MGEAPRHAGLRARCAKQFAEQAGFPLSNEHHARVPGSVHIESHGLPAACRCCRAFDQAIGKVGLTGLKTLNARST